MQQKSAKMVLNPNTKQYMDRMIRDYMDKKLCDADILRLFQDLADSGYAWQMNNTMTLITRKFIEDGLISAPEGYKVTEITAEQFKLIKDRENKVH